VHQFLSRVCTAPGLAEDVVVVEIALNVVIEIVHGCMRILNVC